MNAAPQPLTIEQIRKDCPFPWRTAVMPQQARIIVVDSASKEVPIFHLTRLAELITAKMASEAQ